MIERPLLRRMRTGKTSARGTSAHGASVLRARTLLLLVAMIAVSATLYARDIDYNQSILLATTPRTEGSTNEQQAVRFIVDELNRIGISHRRETFAHYIERFSHSENVYAFIDGRTEQTVVIAVALNTTSTYSLSVLLTLIENYSVSQPTPNIVFAFLGADYWQEKYIGIGSKLLIDSLGSTTIDALLYLNIAFNPSVMEIDIGTARHIAGRTIVERMIRAAKAADQDIAIPSFWRTTTAGYIGSFGDIDDPSSPTDVFLSENISALTLFSSSSNRQSPSSGESSSGVRSPSRTAIDSIQHFVSAIDDPAVGRDNNYFLLPVGKCILYCRRVVGNIHLDCCDYSHLFRHPCE